MPAADHRLTTLEMARFVADGYLRFDGLVEGDLNERIIDEMQRLLPIKVRSAIGVESEDDPGDRPRSGTPLSRCYPPPSAIGELLRLPQIEGIVRSLVGPDPVYDHDFIHFLPARSTYTQQLHVDAIADDDHPSFDVQLFYFPREVGEGAGGTRFVPGSHLRRVRAEGVSRYQHIAGEKRYAGPAGTVLVFHQGLWHAGQANPSERDRWMYKIRLDPTVKQVRLWNTDDFDAVHNDPDDHVFATMRTDSVAHELRKMQPWQSGHEARYELVQRTRLWRYLSGDARFDADYYLSRIELRTRAQQGRT